MVEEKTIQLKVKNLKIKIMQSHQITTKTQQKVKMIAIKEKILYLEE